MPTFVCVANGHRLEVEASLPQAAAKKATVAVGIDSGEVEVRSGGLWHRYAVLGRRYVLPMGWNHEDD